MATWVSWAIALIAAPIGIFVRGLCIAVTWGWFIAPITGWKSISVVEAVGVSIFYTIITGGDKPEKRDYSNMSTKEMSFDLAIFTVAYLIIGPLISLLYAWFWEALFMPNVN